MLGDICRVWRVIVTTGTVPAARLKVLPLMELCTGENQLNTEPIRGSCRITPCNKHRQREGHSFKWTGFLHSPVNFCGHQFTEPALCFYIIYIIYLDANTHLLYEFLLVGLLQLLLCLQDAFPHHLRHVFQKLHRQRITTIKACCMWANILYAGFLATVANPYFRGNIVFCTFCNS